MFPDNDRFGFLGLKSPIARRIHKQVAVVGGIVTLLLAGSEAYLAYQASTSSALEHVASIGRLTAPSLARNLWEFDLDQVQIQLNALVDSGDIDAVLLRQDAQPEIKLGAERLSDSTREQTIPLLYLEEGKQQQLGNLILISDLNKSQEKALVHALLLATEIFALVVLLALLVSTIYYRVVSRRIRLLAKDLNHITPADLLNFAHDSVASSPVAELDEFDELTASVLSLKKTGGQALCDSNDKRAIIEKINKAYQALSATNQIVLEADTETQLLNSVCRIVRHDCGYRLVWIGLAVNDSTQTVCPIAESGYESGYLASVNITWADSERGQGPTGTAIRERRPVIIRDVAHNPSFAPWREQALKRGYVSSAAFPIHDETTVYGALMVYSDTLDAFIDDEISLLTRLTSNVALGMSKLRLEAGRVNAEHALRASEQRFRDYSQASSDWFWEMDNELRFNNFSEGSEQVLGTASEKLLGRKREELTDDSLASPAWQAHLETLQQQKPFRSFEYHVRQEYGDRWFSISGVPHFDAEGRFMGYRGIGTNITERILSEKRLAEAHQAAESANIAKSRFLATMSHEIRTPMNGILGMAQMLLMSEVSDSERQDYARTIMSSGQSLLTLLNNILDLSKIEAGKIELVLQAFEPAQLVHEVIALFSGSAHNKGLQLDGAWRGDKDRRYLADVHRLRRMLSNLVGNALKFTEQGSIMIESRPLQEDGVTAGLEFTVRDTGCGIEPDVQSRLFNPFTQGDNSITRKYGGTGLGLSIVRNLANLMSGEVGVSSAPGQGSCFWFRITAGVVSAEDDTRRTDRSDQVPDKFTTGSLMGRVLVIENDAANRKVILALLEKLGLQTEIRENGQLGLEAVQAGNSFDLILMDLHMPVMDGYDATQRIRAWENQADKPRRPIIALSADVFQEVRERCLLIGMDGFITKPIDFADLYKLMSQYLPSSGQPVEATVSEKIKPPLDMALVRPILQQLLPLLAHNKFDAFPLFARLMALGRGTDLEPELDRINHYMNEMRFDLVARALCEFAAARGSPLEMPCTGNR